MNGERDAVACPHCSHALSAEVVAQVSNQSIVSMRLCPSPGELMQASTIGGSISSFGQLMEAAGRELRAPTVSLVKSITSDEDGSVTITLLVARGPEVAARKRRINRAAGKEVTP
jgi:hypothetical protein